MGATANTGILRNGRFAWGKHEGKLLRDVPSEYLSFLIESSQATIEQLQAELDRRAQVEEANLSWLERIVQTGYRELSKRHHPDAGGDSDEMRELNAAVEALRQILREKA